MNKARCRGCGAEIDLVLNEIWMDSEGITACIKGRARGPEDPPAGPGESLFIPPVPHEPMPAGLAGAPSGVTEAS